jgi:predicted ferric reductase
MDGMDMDCDPGVVNLPLSDPRCIQAVECCTAFYAGENESQTVTPWALQFEYGHWLTYYWVIIVGLFTLWRAFTLIIDRRIPKSNVVSKGPGVLDKAQAITRFLSYRSIDKQPVRSCISLPRVGLLSLLVITCSFILALLLTERPYYRPQLGFGSPPIAIRSGLMAFACLPILMALGGKANIITLLTGISHERLNVIHQWVGWMCFVLSLVHTIPFFIASVMDPGNGGFDRVVKEFYADYEGLMFEVCHIYARPTALVNRPSNSSYVLSQYSGVPPLALLFGLCVLSLPLIRKRFYESFYVAHILMAIPFFGLLFWHSDNTLDSWSYLWATLAIWLAAWLTRLFWFMRGTSIRSRLFSSSPAVIKMMPSNLLRLEVERPKGFNFMPGQHAYLRFPSLSVADNHPFTMALSSNYKPNTAEDSEPVDTLLFLAKVHEGFTQKLAVGCARSDGEMRTSVLLDGPYGGLSRPRLENRFDSILLIAGGSGITGCLSWLSYMTSVCLPTRVRTVTLIWAVREAGALEWALPELQALHCDGDLKVKFKFYITGNVNCINSAVDGEQSTEKGDGSSGLNETTFPTQRAQQIGEVMQGRPDLRGAVDDAMNMDERLAVLVSGPYKMNHDMANIVADAQKHVLKGKAKNICLIVETFGW